MGLPSGIFNFSYAQDMAVMRTKTQWGLSIATIVFFLCFPFFGGSHWIYMLIQMMITLIVVLGAQIIFGYCGQITIAQAAFMAVGAYASGILITQFNLPFLAAFISAGIIAGLLGVFFAIPAARIKGWYLAISTIAAQFILIFVIFHDVFKPWFTTAGARALMVPSASIAGFVFDSDFRFYFLIFAVTLLLLYTTKRLAMMRTGRAWIAIRDNDLAAEAMGINIFRYKLLAFFIGCFYAGIAGSLWAHYTNIASCEQYTFINSIWYIGMVVLGGVGSVTGAIFGTVAFRLLWEYSYAYAGEIAAVIPVLGRLSATAPMIVVGLTIILIMIFEPRGLYHRWLLFRTSYRLWPFRY